MTKTDFELTPIVCEMTVVDTYSENEIVPVAKRMRPGMAIRRALVVDFPNFFPGDVGVMGFPGEIIDRRP